MHRIDDRNRLTEIKTIATQAPVKKADQDAYEEPFRKDGIRRERRGVHAKLRSTLLQGYKTPDDFEDALDNKGSTILHLPPSRNHEKRGKGTTYDRGRSSQWQKSARTHLKKGRETTSRPEVRKFPNQDIPQVKRHILSYREAIKDVFTGKRLPPQKTLTRKDLLARIERLEIR